MNTRKNKNKTRAQLKKSKKSFKVGDIITWGLGIISHRVIEVLDIGVIVDISSTKTYSDTYFVAYDGNIKCGKGGHWARHSNDPPDVPKPLTDPLTGKSNTNPDEY